MGYSVDPVDPDDGQTIIPMPCNQESSNATNVANAFNGLEALSEMQSLKFRKPKFEKQAHYIIIYIRTVRPYLLFRGHSTTTWTRREEGCPLNVHVDQNLKNNVIKKTSFVPIQNKKVLIGWQHCNISLVFLFRPGLFKISLILSKNEWTTRKMLYFEN